jgi:hypothetical protein
MMGCLKNKSNSAYHLSLLGEMLWNPNRSEKEVLEAALSPYYRIVE